MAGSNDSGFGGNDSTATAEYLGTLSFDTPGTSFNFYESFYIGPNGDGTLDSRDYYKFDTVGLAELRLDLHPFGLPSTGSYQAGLSYYVNYDTNKFVTVHLLYDGGSRDGTWHRLNPDADLLAAGYATVDGNTDYWMRSTGTETTYFIFDETTFNASFDPHLIVPVGSGTDDTITLQVTGHWFSNPSVYLFDTQGNSQGEERVNLTLEVMPWSASTGGTTGTSGNDTMPNGQGNDNFDGGAGIDTLQCSGNRSAYSIASSGSGFTLGGPEGTDTLANIERLQFADTKIALDLLPTGHAGQALEFIGTIAFSVIDSPTVVGAIISFFDDGHTLTTLSQLAIDVGLIRDLAGSDSNADLARLVFRNIIEQEADSQTVDALVSYMDGRNASLSQAEFIAILAEWEGNQQHIDLVGLQQTGVEFTV